MLKLLVALVIRRSCQKSFALIVMHLSLRVVFPVIIVEPKLLVAVSDTKSTHKTCIYDYGLSCLLQQHCHKTDKSCLLYLQSNIYTTDFVGVVRPYNMSDALGVVYTNSNAPGNTNYCGYFEQKSLQKIFFLSAIVSRKVFNLNTNIFVYLILR